MKTITDITRRKQGVTVESLKDEMVAADNEAAQDHWYTGYTPNFQQVSVYISLRPRLLVLVMLLIL